MVKGRETFFICFCIYFSFMAAKMRNAWCEPQQQQRKKKLFILDFFSSINFFFFLFSTNCIIICHFFSSSSFIILSFYFYWIEVIYYDYGVWLWWRCSICDVRARVRIVSMVVCVCVLFFFYLLPFLLQLFVNIIHVIVCECN